MLDTEYMTLIGSHVSTAGGVENAPERAAKYGNEVLQMFTRSPQGGKAPELTDKIVSQFKKQVTRYKIQNIYVHAPYYINFASANNRTRYGSVSVIREELERCSLLGVKYLMTHLGSAKELGEKKSLEKTISGLEKVLDGYRGSAKLLLENSAGSGKVVGDTFDELGAILKAVPLVAGVCLDTQHSWASGYDWVGDFENVLGEINTHIGLGHVKLIHGNDSMTELGSRVDRHEHIGKGKIGAAGFKNIMRFALDHDLDIIYETKDPGKEKDMEMLSALRAEIKRER